MDVVSPDTLLTSEELVILKKLDTPIKIQDYLDSLPINHEKDGDTYMSVRRAIREQKAHCLEGAFIACAALMLTGERPLILDLKTVRGANDRLMDADHVVALYKRNGYWGAISKTNHATLRFRDPIYKTIRELAASYFHEYFLDTNGKKTLRWYSKPLSLRRFKNEWLTSEENLWHIATALDEIPHFALFPEENLKYIRPADSMERLAGALIEWKKSDKRT
jgi:hypothetical protein